MRIDVNSYRIRRLVLGVILGVGAGLAGPPATSRGQDVPPVDVPDAVATTEAEMKPYTEVIEQTTATFDLVPIPGGRFLMGSPEDEPGREEDEGPQHEVEISPFWMSTTEITWDVYDVWMSDLDVFRRNVLKLQPTPRDALADQFQISQPTKPYTDMSFGMGKRGYPAICMTQHAARVFCKWLSAKTGRYYRLPTEAEWEYACRAGTTTAYSFGDDPGELEEYAWFFDNTDGAYERVGQKKPNPWGLYDMHGNVAEWVLDQYEEAGYASVLDQPRDPLAVPLTLYPRVVRGGGWNQFPEDCRSAAREASHEDWKRQDPQQPKSIWYHTDALHVGFRVVRPLRVPSAEERAQKWDKSLPEQKDGANSKG
ncbi:MAG: formylglycine-generating enzyme family protein [Planctomycetota bacterium]|nr:MAG: formylglycine-generating enzyme family protein [Planctomycetota bacterium]